MKKILIGLAALASLSFANSNEYDYLFDKYSKSYNINKNFIKKIALIESGLNGNKVTKSLNGNDTFVGLFQVSEKFYKVNSSNIDNEDITNKAVKHMKYCLDKKGYTVKMINCFNSSYTDSQKKELLLLLKQKNND